ncbi:MAG: hypothetical protein DMF85_11695 [Acidobacteria bacterium]|nr:MAG: hypothetical protein DMF85_11695 [Acidobacteriota bacterium]
MPRTRSLAWSELKVGMLAVGALVLAGMLIIAVGGQSGFAWQRYELRTKFDNVQGLKSGAIVRVAGVEVGKVTKVGFAGPAVEVRLSIREEMQSRVTTDSRASIGSLSLLGEPIIDVTPASTGRPLKDGEYIQSSRPAGQLSDIRAGKGTVGKLFTDEQLYREFNQLIGSAQQVTGYMSRGQGTFGKLLRDPKAYQQFQAALTNLQETTRRINAGEGSLGRLLKDEAFAKSLTSATANFDQVSGRLTRGDNTFGKLLTEKELYDRLNSTTARLDKLVSDLNQGEGTAGQLLRNKEMYENMNKTFSELRSLVADIRKDPKKYLNVKVSIF